MEDSFAIPLAFLSDNDLSDEDLEDVEEEEDFYDFIPFQQEFLMPMRDRAFSWDVSFEDGLHGENFHNFTSSSMEGANPKLVIKAKRMSVTVKTESGTSVVVKSEKEIKTFEKNDNKKNNNKSTGGSSKKKDGSSDSQSSKTDSPPTKNSSFGSSTSSTALPMKPPTKPPSHSSSSASLRNGVSSNINSSSGAATTIKAEPGIAMEQHSDGYDSSQYSGDELGPLFPYSRDFNEVNDQAFDHSVRSLERILMPDGVSGSMDSTTSSNADSVNGGLTSTKEGGPSDGFASSSTINNNSSGINGNATCISSSGSSSSIKPASSSLAPITGVHSHSLIGASPGGSLGLDGSYSSSSSGMTSSLGGNSSSGQVQTPNSMLNKPVVGYSPMASGAEGGVNSTNTASSSSGAVVKTTPLSSVHQHSTNPYSPYTPAVGGLGVVGSSGLLGSSSGGGIAALGNATGMLGLNVGGLHTNTIMPSNNPNGEYRVGAYTREERQMKIEMFRAKKRKRIWRKQIKYDCRKRLADTRPRVKGRFVSRKLGDNDDIAALMGGMLDEEMEGGMVGMGGGPMMDPTGMMMLGGSGAAGMMMLGHNGGGRVMGGSSGGGKSKKQLKSELQAMQIQQRYAAAVYGSAAGDPSAMMFMGMPGDPQQMMYHMDYVNGGAGGMLGMMGSAPGGDMSNPQLQGLLNFNGAAFSPTASAVTGAAGGGEQPLLQHHDMFLSSDQMLLKQQQQMMHTQHMLQQQQLYRESLNLGASPFASGMNPGANGGNLLLSPNSAAAVAANLSTANYLNSLSVTGLNNSGLVGIGQSIAGEGLLNGMPGAAPCLNGPALDGTAAVGANIKTEPGVGASEGIATSAAAPVPADGAAPAAASAE